MDDNLPSTVVLLSLSFVFSSAILLVGSIVGEGDIVAVVPGDDSVSGEIDDEIDDEILCFGDAERVEIDASSDNDFDVLISSSEASKCVSSSFSSL